MTVNKFKVGDVVKCVYDGGVKINLTTGKIKAFNAYKEAKEAFVKEQAEKWKSQIDPRAYKALMNYQVEITD